MPLASLVIISTNQTISGLVSVCVRRLQSGNGYCAVLSRAGRIKEGITKGRIGRKWRPGASRSRGSRRRRRLVALPLLLLRIDRLRCRRVSFLKSLDVRILAPAEEIWSASEAH